MHTMQSFHTLRATQTTAFGTHWLSHALRQRPCHALRAPQRRVLQCRTQSAPRNDGTSTSGNQAEQLLDSGKQLFASNDRMAALEKFESATRMEGSREQLAAAWFNIACVHASFGDVEPAQAALRAAIVNGLVLEQAMADPELLKLAATPQVMIQLKRFATNVRKQMADGALPSAATSRAGASVSREAQARPQPRATRGAGSLPSTGARPGWRQSIQSGLDTDLSDILQTENNGIDGSLGAIIRRVLLVVLALTLLGVALFYLGLQYAFPDGY